MVLQLFVDDSGNEPNQELFVLGGLLSTAERWAEFTKAWNEALAEPPGAAFVKFKEATRLRGQFDEKRGWTQALRNTLCEKLAAIAHEHVLARFHVSMRHDHFARYVRSIPAPRRSLLTDHPYSFLISRMAAVISTALTSMGISDQCDFYLDTQEGQDATLRVLWPAIVESAKTAPPELMPNGTVPNLGPDLRFEREEEFPPLQAADLYASGWRKLRMGEGVPGYLLDIFHIPYDDNESDEADVQDLGARYFEHITEVRAAHPELELFGYDPETASRDRKRTRRGLKPRRPISDDDGSYS